ncbi:hypothetical protein P3T36_005048 [Kitasatospora sp. MAP12-15]|uniref:hypothetical protein n=1 Tax=unclassified Kitasatospora TaxID=2633591 RepID=UPI0024770F98|nr:hypothetical protein [Kitasatospora sp. MAP12-44]MDH6111975.1 hypothetical protein [Kitasatospora sp. MAP12-44]
MSLDTPVPETAAESAMSRRALIRNATVVGAVGLTAGVLCGLDSGGAEAEPAADHPMAIDRDQPTVVHLRDARTGELDIFHGDRHHRVQDRELAAALLRTLG